MERIAFLFGVLSYFIARHRIFVMTRRWVLRRRRVGGGARREGTDRRPGSHDYFLCFLDLG